MSEQKTGTITLTVPWHEDPVARAAGTLWDGRDRTGAAKDGRSIAVLHADIGKALLAAWPGEATSDYAKRLAEIEATFAAWDWHCDDDADPANDPGVGAVQALRDLEGSSPHQLRWLLAQHRAASEALTALGVPDDGRPLAERIEARGQSRRHGLADPAAIVDDVHTGDDACPECGDLAGPQPCSQSDGDAFTLDPPRFTGSKEATIAKLAEVDPTLAADVARANGVDTKG